MVQCYSQVRRSLAFVVATLIFSCGAVVSAQSHYRPLRDATERYRDAVDRFQDEVDHADFLDRSHRRLIDRLDEASGELRNASRRADDLTRLERALRLVDTLQAQAEQLIFGRGCPMTQARLAGPWQQVKLAFDGVVYQFQAYQSAYGGYTAQRPAVPFCPPAIPPVVDRFDPRFPRHEGYSQPQRFPMGPALPSVPLLPAAPVSPWGTTVSPQFGGSGGPALGMAILQAIFSESMRVR